MSVSLPHDVAGLTVSRVDGQNRREIKTTLGIQGIFRTMLQ